MIINLRFLRRSIKYPIPEEALRSNKKANATGQYRAKKYAGQKDPPILT